MFVLLLAFLAVACIHLFVYSQCQRLFRRWCASTAAQSADPEKSDTALLLDPSSADVEKGQAATESKIAQPSRRIVVAGAGVIGLTTACEIQERFPTALITLAADRFATDSPQDLDSSYCSAYVCSQKLSYYSH